MPRFLVSQGATLAIVLGLRLGGAHQGKRQQRGEGQQSERLLSTPDGVMDHGVPREIIVVRFGYRHIDE